MKNRPSTLLAIICFIAILCAVIYGLIWLRNSNRFAIQFVQVHDDYHFVEPAQIKHTMQPYLHANFFSLDVGALERALANIPAVAHVQLSRKWPDTLIVSINERQPIAIWNDTQLLDKTGALFTAPRTPSWALLPHFIGQKRTIKTMLSQYQQMQTALSADHLVIKTYSLSATGNVSLQLIPGIFWLYLGNRFSSQRLTRFIGSYSTLLASNPTHKIAYIDLRYPQGMAVRWITAPRH